MFESQWNRLLSINWTKIFGENILNDCYSFWLCVYLFKNADGKYIKKKISIICTQAVITTVKQL